MPSGSLVRYAALGNFIELSRSLGLDPAVMIRDVGLDPAGLTLQDRRWPRTGPTSGYGSPSSAGSRTSGR